MPDPSGVTRSPTFDFSLRNVGSSALRRTESHAQFTPAPPLGASALFTVSDALTPAPPFPVSRFFRGSDAVTSAISGTGPSPLTTTFSTPADDSSGGSLSVGALCGIIAAGVVLLAAIGIVAFVKRDWTYVSTSGDEMNTRPDTGGSTAFSHVDTAMNTWVGAETLDSALWMTSDQSLINTGFRLDNPGIE
jgi:hypothetical protein